MTRMRVRLSLTALAAACILAACTSTPPSPAAPPPPPSGEVQSGMITPQASDRMQLASNEIFIPGTLSNPEVMPSYPETLLAQRLPDQTVCIGFVVEANGAVTRPEPLYARDGCPNSASDVSAQFIEAALGAVSQWDFYSFLRCSFPPGTPDAQKCNGPGARTEQVAVSLAYRFIFQVRDGKGQVETRAQPTKTAQ